MTEAESYHRQMIEDHSAIFVFGSNLAGFHGAGAALAAKTYYGAEEGVGAGPTGRCYAIPTKDWRIRTLKLYTIAPYIGLFVGHAMLHPQNKFIVSRIACGLAGYSDKQIAPLFKHAPENCILHERWERVIDNLGGRDIL